MAERLIFAEDISKKLRFNAIVSYIAVCYSLYRAFMKVQNGGIYRNGESMKKNKIALMLIVGGVLAGLAGCGKSQQTTGTPKEEVYVPEYKDLDLQIDYIGRVAAAGDTVYFESSSYDEENETSTDQIFAYDFQKEELKTLDYSLDQDESVYNIAATPDGKLVALICRTTYDEDENGEVTNWETAYEVDILSADGASVEKTIDLSPFLSPEQYVQEMCVDTKGNLYIFDGDSKIMVLDGNGTKLCDVQVDNWINDMTVSKEGDVYVSIYGDNDMEIRKIDLAAKGLSEKIEGIAEGYGNISFYTGTSKSLLLSEDGKFFSYDLGSGSREELFNCLEVDINSDYVQAAGELADGRLWLLLNDYDGSDEKNSISMVLIKKVKASEVTPKTEITYGAMWLDYNLKKNIIDFNKNSKDYRIIVKEYGNDDYSAALAQFNADLTTGNCPDIIDLSSLNYKQYAEKGALEDLYPYMESNSMKKSDYLENVLKAYEVDGRLYAVIPQFSVSTVMAKADKVGKISGWTLSEMLDFAEGQDAENIFPYGDRYSIFYFCIYNNIDEFIDWETGKCSFDGGDFARVLEFAARFPEEDIGESDMGISARLRADKILLMEDYVSSVQEYQMMNGLFGEEVSYVGYPNQERQGNLISPQGGCVGISAKSKNKEGAFEFVKSLLSDEYQNSLVSEHGSWGFPVKRSALEKQFEMDMTPEYTEDENGEKIECPKTTWGYDDFDMEIYAATSDEVDAIRALLETADRATGNVDDQLVNIITEETEPFFKGQKSAEDTAAVIQNRIQIYVNENR